VNNATWLGFAGTEISDAHRTIAYLREPGLAASMGACAPYAALSCGCAADDLGPYVSPAVDAAPWYDARAPESAEFLGLVLSTVDGLDGSPLTRSASALATTDGGVLSRLRLSYRELTFTGTLYAVSECGLEYGRRWLTEAVKGLPCDDCDLDQLCVRVCCPPADGPDTGLKTLLRVGVTSPPAYTYPLEQCRCYIADVTWQMTAETPWVFDDPITAGVLRFDAGTAHCIDVCSTACPDEEPTDSSLTQSYCEPWCRTDIVCATVPRQPDWCDAASLITVTNGGSRLTRLVLKFWENESRLSDLYEDTYSDTYIFEPVTVCADVSPDFWRCLPPCNIIGVSYLPASGTLTLDGRTHRADVSYSDGSREPGDKYVTGWFGAIDYQDFGCANMCVCGYASTEDLSSNVSVTVQYVPRTGG
jgi:hypothetical protein